MDALDGCDGRVLCQRRGNRFASLRTDEVRSKRGEKEEEERERVEGVSVLVIIKQCPLASQRREENCALRREENCAFKDGK